MHVLAASRDAGHCFLTDRQIDEGIKLLIELDLGATLGERLQQMERDNQLRVRQLMREGALTACYYSKTLYYDENTVADRLRSMQGAMSLDGERVISWVHRYCNKHAIALSDEQAQAVSGVVQHRFSILTGGPGCGKTTTTLVIVRLLEAMNKRVLLAAPTGRAAQRMGEVIGREAKTLHRLLEWKAGAFQVNEEAPLQADYLIVDECSMLDISLSASLLKAVPAGCQTLFIGDADQLPSVGAGNVLKDMIASQVVPCFRLTEVFRQAKQSQIIRYAHYINQGRMPPIDTPFKKPEIWRDGSDCLFLDSNEATREEIGFVGRVKRFFDWKLSEMETAQLQHQSPFEFRVAEPITSAYDQDFVVPGKFQHVDLPQLHRSASQVAALKSVLKQIHPWSSLHFGLSAVDVVSKLYLEWLPKYVGAGTEIQILSPMTRGTLGTVNLNKVIQQAANPAAPGKHELKIGERIFRDGDRVIHRRNNYDLNVFNGDIGKIESIDNEQLTCVVTFFPDGREVHYKKEDIMELDLAYAITIHKSQGSEFEAVILPVFTQHFNMLYRNLIYTGLTRAKKQAVFVGTRRALSMAVRRQDTSLRQTALTELLTQTD
jgi:exodeoxyribonuclease V alpha subunit